MIVGLRHAAAEGRDAGAQHIHRMAGRRELLEHGGHRCGQRTQPLQFRFIGCKLRRIRQSFVHQQVGDFLEFALRGDVENIVAAIVQVIAGPADRAQGGVAGHDAGQSDGFLRFECARG